MDNTDRLAFKAAVMTAINKQKFVIDLDEQIDCLREICSDIKEEEERQLETMDMRRNA